MSDLPTNTEMDAFRQVGDELADEVVAELSRRRLHSDPVDALEQLAMEDFEPAVNLWAQVNSVPDWVDFDFMRPAFDVAVKNVIPSGMALMAGSLIESYASGRGAKVLTATGRLRDDTLRRLFETAKFTSDLALGGGAVPGTLAWRNVVAVRLMHAWVRHGLRRKPDWDHDAWGLPVNQEDYAATLFMFSLVYRRSLERLGVPLTPDEHSGAQMNWRHVGWLMGVDPVLLAVDVDDERRRYQAMRQRNYAPDEDSRALAHDLLGAMARQPPFFLPERALHAMARHLIGDELADAFELESSRTWSAAFKGSRAMTLVTAKIARHVDSPSLWVGSHLTRGIVRFGLPDGTRFASES